MSAYVIANLEVTDPDGFAVYAGKAPATITAHGGEYLVRGGAAESLEGELPVGRIVVIRFPSVEAARAWYHSPEYRAVRAERRRAAHGPLILAPGLDEARTQDPPGGSSLSPGATP